MRLPHPLVDFAFGLAGMMLAVTVSAVEPSRGFAVVELFTSEGCSSCPPADRLLAELYRRREQGDAIYCLGYHVDYWDKLGWKDRFGSTAMTRRQQAYSRVLELDRIYTPQMIVNGTVEFVGSDRKLAEKAVNAALTELPTRSLTISTAAGSTEHEIAVNYRLDAPLTDQIITAALVQRRGESRVARGENEGRRLQHIGIVRMLKSAAADGQATGTIRLTRPADVPAAELDLIAFLQDPKSGRIVAATMTAVARP